MITMTQDILDYLKIRTPFYDRYILVKAKGKKKSPECLIDRVYVSQTGHVFSLILRDSKPEKFAANLLNPDKWINPTKNAVKARKASFKKKDIRLMKIKNHRTEAAINGTNEQTIKKELRDAHTILFETEFEDLPLLAHMKNWGWLVTIMYEIQRAEQIGKTLMAPVKPLEETPETGAIPKKEQ